MTTSNHPGLASGLFAGRDPLMALRPEQIRMPERLLARQRPDGLQR